MTQSNYEYENKNYTSQELMRIFKKYSSLNRFKLVYQLIDGVQNKILDVGCGAGYLSDFLKNKIKEYVGTDLLARNIQIANEFFKSKNRIFTSKDIFSNNPKIFKKNYFDYVLLLEVLEHADAPVKLIQKCKQLLKKGGHLIISVPNALSLTNILLNIKRKNHVVRNFLFTGTETDHIYSWDKLTLQSLLVKFGFKIIDVKLSKQTLFGGQSILVKAKRDN